MKKGTKYHRILKITILLILVAILSSLLTRMAYYSFHDGIYDINDIPATFSVGDVLGLAANADELNFGKVTPGGSSTKEITLSHSYRKPLKVRFEYIGSIAEVLYPIEPFYLEPDTERKIHLTARAITTEPKTYNGTVRIIYSR